MDLLHTLFNAQTWISLLNQAARGLALAIPIALVAEGLNWVSRRWVLAQLAPAFNRDSARDATLRLRRRRLLRDFTSAGLRWLWNTAALLTILTLWRLEALAAALVLACVVVVFRALLADAVANWSLLLDDALAPGDQVVLNGTVSGTVSDCGLRRVKLTDAAGQTWWIRCSEVKTIQVVTPALAATDLVPGLPEPSGEQGSPSQNRGRGR